MLLIIRRYLILQHSIDLQRKVKGPINRYLIILFKGRGGRDDRYPACIPYTVTAMIKKRVIRPVFFTWMMYSSRRNLGGNTRRCILREFRILGINHGAWPRRGSGCKSRQTVLVACCSSLCFFHNPFHFVLDRHCWTQREM